MKRVQCTSSHAMERERACSPCGPECKELDLREPKEALFAEGGLDDQTANVNVGGLVTSCVCICSSAGNTRSSLPLATTASSSVMLAPLKAAFSDSTSGSCCLTPNTTAGQGVSSASGLSGTMTSCAMSNDTSGGKSTCRSNTATVSQGSSTSLGGRASSGGSVSGGGASRIRRLLRGRAHSSHGGTSTNPSCSTQDEERISAGRLAGSCRGQNTSGNIRNCRRSASKSTSSLLDASSMPSSSYSCCGTSTSSSAIWSNSNSLYPEVASSAVSPLMQPPMTSNNQQQLPAISSGSFTNTNSQATLTATTTPQKTKIKVGSWALKLCKRSSPGNSGTNANSTNSGAYSSCSQGGTGVQGALVKTAATCCNSGSVASKSTNSSPSKGPASLGYSVCHQGGLSASLPLAPPQENIHHRYHYHQHHRSHNQHESGISVQLNNEVLCVCCTAGTSRDVPGGSLGSGASVNISVCGAPAAQSSGTPNATRRRMATAIINQLSSSSLEANDGNQGSLPLGAFGSLGGSDDFDERARIERAREIAEGVDPPPGFIRAHEVIPDEIAAALRSLNLDALPWDVLGKIWDLNPSPHQIPLSLAAAAAANHGHGPAGSGNCGGVSSSANGTTVHTTVDYMHCLVPDLAQISRCGFYWGKMDRYEAERLLQKKPEGSFLLRDSAQEEYLFSVSFRRYGRSLHARIEQWNHNFSFDSHDPGVFSSPTVCGLIEHYKDPACCMYFEPMLTMPINRNFPFSLQHLARCAITERVNYDDVSRLHLPKPIKAYLREYHYKQRLRVRNVERE